MITLDHKFQFFSQSVLSKAQAGYEEQLQAMEARNRQQLEAFKAEVEEKALEIRDKITRQGLYEKKMRIARAQMDRKRRLMLKKDELMETLIHQVRLRLEAFAAQEEYGDFVEKLLLHFTAELQRMDGLFLMIREQDRVLFKERIEPAVRRAVGELPAGIRYGELPEDAIGGLLLFNDRQTIRYDLTLRALLEDQRSAIGEQLHEIFDKAGMADE